MIMDFNVQFDFRPPSMDSIEREYYVFVLDHCENNKYEAAEILGVTLKTIYNKLDKWGIGDEYRVHGKKRNPPGYMGDVNGAGCDPDVP